MRLGELDLHLVSDGKMRLDGGMMFGVVPRVVWEKRMPPDAQNRVELELNCLLVCGPWGNALVDTGLGTNLDANQLEKIWGLTGEGRLLANLAALGLTPSDIDLVVNTHLHVDHAGGNTIRRGERLVPAFPRARYVVQRREWEDAMHVTERTRASYIPQHLAPVAEAGQLELIDGEKQVAPHLRCIPTPGHTRGHQSVLIGRGERKALHLGDVAPFAVHFERLAWIPAMDMLPLETLESKRSLLDEVIKQDYLLIFYHENSHVAARLIQDGGGYRVLPVPFQ